MTNGQINELKIFFSDFVASREKCLLILRGKNNVKYTKWFRKHKSELGAFMPSTANKYNKRPPSKIEIVSSDTFLSNLVSSYTASKDNSSNVILNALLQPLSEKINGQINDP